MSVTTNNIIVGPGDLFVADSLSTALPSVTASSSASASLVRDALENDSAWTSLGATEGGVELAYEPTYDDVMIDQWKDAARLHLTQQTFNFTTNLMESTLENLILAWGYNSADALVAGAQTGTDGITNTFNLGVLGEDPCEYQFAIVSKGVGGQPDCAPGSKVERVYVARRVVSVQGSTLGLRRTEATTFPVTFRMLPYDQAATGEEYGYVYDRDITQITG